MPDRREEILEAEHRRGSNTITPKGYSQWVLNAMDENGKQMCFELLEYMAKNEYKCYWMEDDDGEPYYFFSKGAGHQNIRKEELFENFL